MAWETPLRLPLSTGDRSFGAAIATGLLGAVAFGPLFFQRYLPPWTFWLVLGLGGLWLLFLILLGIQFWSGRASDARIDAAGLSILSGPHRGRAFSWTELGSLPIQVTRDGSFATLKLGEVSLARTNVPEEGASLEALAATLRAGASDRVPDAPVGPEVEKCVKCGAPLVPSDEDLTRCGFCRTDNVMPERVRHVAGAAGAGERVQRAVRSLLKWPPAGRLNAYLVASLGAAVLAWPFFAAAALVAQSRPDHTILDLLVLLCVGLCAGLTFPSLLSAATEDRRSFELLSARFAAAPPPAPDRPYGCRHCGGPLPDPHGRSTTPAVAVCAYCESRNLVGLGLAREAKDTHSDADSLEQLAADRLRVRRRRRLRAVFPILLVLVSPLQFANVMFELPCFGPVGTCAGPHEARWCVGGESTPVRCGGPRGCDQSGLQIFCDQSVAAVGELCLGPPRSVACTEDRGTMLRCEGHRYVLAMRCRGPDRCHREDDRIHCDTSVAASGDPCAGDRYACAADGRALLACRDARWVALHPADSCEIVDGRLVWTGAYAVVGERCAEGSAACTDDDRLLRCRDGALAPFVECRGPSGCTSEGTRHRCDQSIAAVGDACAMEASACSVDGGSMLRCRDGEYAEERECPEGCTAADGRVSCRAR